jgi:hypothetical protein
MPRLTSATSFMLAMLLALLAVSSDALAASSPGPTRAPAWVYTKKAGTSSAAVPASADEEGEEEREEDEGEEVGAAETSTETPLSGTTGSSSNHPSDSNGTSGPSDPGARASVAIVSQLKLTARGLAALEHHQPSASTLGFSFMLSAPAIVKVTLVKQMGSHGERHWQPLPDSLIVNAAKGRVNRRLRGRNRLTRGRYRLTVKPLAGSPRSIYLSARR